MNHPKAKRKKRFNKYADDLVEVKIGDKVFGY